jgi:hypothetical protein
MFRYIFLFLFIFLNLKAEIYLFQEIRYSYAIDKSIKLRGNIEFSQNGLKINYPNEDKTLNYSDGILKFINKQKIQKLDNETIERISQYFEMLILLYRGDEKVLLKSFNIYKENNLSILVPKNNLSYYIAKIELQKENKQLKGIKIILVNKDIIKVRIGNEVR